MKASFVVVGILAVAVAVAADQVLEQGGFRRAKKCELQSQQPTGFHRGLPPLARGPQRQPLPPSTGSFFNPRGLIGRTGRRRRQAGKLFDPTNTPFRWYKADASTLDGAACEAQEPRHVSVRGPVVVPFGKYDVCVKFDAANRWFRTIGSNGHCNPDGKCCDWFPPSQCNSRIAVPKWFPLPDGFSACKDVPEADKKVVAAAEYLSNASPNQQTKICVQKVAENESDPVEFILDEVTVTHCFDGCCIFKRNQEQ